MIQQPKHTREQLEELLKPYSIEREKYPLLIVGLRGYDKGTDGKNNRGIYDDALAILSKNVYAVFKANTDPSRVGFNKKVRKGFAVLQSGFYPSYRFDVHNSSSPHEAICQRAGTVTVLRDGGKVEKGFFGINIHRGGLHTTSSEGCQTLPLNTWKEFYSIARGEAQKLWGNNWKKEIVGYCLIEL